MTTVVLADFQATNPSDIATGFLTLTNKFIQQSARISQ